MPNSYWSLKYLEMQGGKLSTDGKSFTLGGRTIPCRVVKYNNNARIIFNRNLMKTPQQQLEGTMYTPKQSEESAPTVQLPTCLYIKASILPSALLALVKDSVFTTIGNTRYLRLKCEIRQAGLVLDQIF